MARTKVTARKNSSRIKWPLLIHAFWETGSIGASGVRFQQCEVFDGIQRWKKFSPPAVPAGLLRRQGVTCIPEDVDNDTIIHVLLEPWRKLQLQLEMYVRLQEEARDEAFAMRAFSFTGSRLLSDCRLDGLGPPLYTDSHGRAAATLEEASLLAELEPLEARLPAKTIKGFRKTACGMLAVYAASEDDAWAFNHPRGLFWAGKIVGRRGRGIRLQWYKLDPQLRSATLTSQEDWLGERGFCGCTESNALGDDVCECFEAVVNAFLAGD